MNRIPIQKLEENRVFNTSFYSNGSVIKVDLKKQNRDSIINNINFDNQNITVKSKESQNNFEVKADVNNAPVEDIYYDEIIFYDGGGVDGWL